MSFCLQIFALNKYIFVWCQYEGVHCTPPRFDPELRVGFLLIHSTSQHARLVLLHCFAVLVNAFVCVSVCMVPGDGLECIPAARLVFPG